MPSPRDRLAREPDFLVAPRVAPPLDAAFRPAVLARRRFAEWCGRTGASVPAAVAVEQPGGHVYVRETRLLPDGHPGALVGHAFSERLVKSMLWSRGGSTIWVDGPPGLAEALRRHYADEPVGRFDSQLVGEAVHGRPLEVCAAPRAEFPASRERTAALGGHLEGCRIGFDLGASDRKAAAVVDGTVVFSEEVAWDPARHADPQWHRDEIMDSLRRAAAHLPRVDAIGGSAAGIYVDSEVRVASLFRAVPPDVFATRVRGLFSELRDAWRGVPFVVVNDGEVTALAGSMLAGVGGLLGIAMGSSEAAGYVTPDGHLTGWLDELAFAPIDYAPTAPRDEWSGDRGCGVSYLSQQATGRLLRPAGLEPRAGASLPERLVFLQERLAGGDERAARVYETIGSYLGYALLDYAHFYEFGHVLVLGRVMTGGGGDIILARAREVLDVEGDVATRRLLFHTVSEQEKRHGQAVAAASLPG